MNTYKIIFTRENGTQGTDHFTAINERQARKDFGECYRHGTGTIISIELVSTNAPVSTPSTSMVWNCRWRNLMCLAKTLRHLFLCFIRVAT